MANPNLLTDPPFAADPPVKVNVNAKVLGLVIGIVAVVLAVFGLLGLIAVFSACTIAGITVSGCGLPILWLLGSIVGLGGYIVAAIGGFRMYQLDREGKTYVIYGIALGVLGSLVYLIGNIIFYSGSLLSGYAVGYGGAIVFFIIGVLVDFVVYYMVVISRYPGEAPLVPTTGYGAPPPPPPPTV